MRMLRPLFLRGMALLIAACPRVCSADPSLTIYNQNFAVVRETARLDLKAGENEVRFTDITARLEPDSLLLRDPSGKRALRVLEQSYRPDILSQDRLLSLYEGKTLEFLVLRDGRSQIVRGKVIRGGYKPPPTSQPYYGGFGYGSSGLTIVEVDGKVQFGLPGVPLFPALAEGTEVRPTLNWTLWTDRAGPLEAELAYVTGGMGWRADYNVVAPETGDVMDLIGWVTMENTSGKTFENARIKLMAGDPSKIQPGQGYAAGGFAGGGGGVPPPPPPVTERSFDEYHLYTLPRPATLREQETKQVEFARATGIKTKRVYVYDGAQIDLPQYRGYPQENLRGQREYGTQTNTKVWVMREFANAVANGLGIPLPRGRLRFYRRDAGGALEFVGENIIDHTPKDETIRVATGDAFDLVGERRSTDYRIDNDRDILDETFEIKVRNHKKEPVEVRVVEHLYRWGNWEITAKSDPFLRTDSRTVEFRLPIPPDAERTLVYTVHYTW